MSNAPQDDTPEGEVDVVESLVGVVPWVIPLVGGVLIFMLAFIAVLLGA